jgi:uncharacterized protein (TIGR03086 family)
MEHIQDMHARAVRVSTSLVSRVAPGDMNRATPCAGWTLADLIAHMVAHHRGFAAAARGAGTTNADWDPVALSADVPGEYAAVAEDVVAAFSEDGVLDREIVIPVLSPTRRFPGRDAIGFHLIDYVVHSWDVARALGLSVAFERDVLAEATLLALEVPDGSYRMQPGALFAPPVPVPRGAAALDRIVAILGRSPAWPD